MKKGLVPKRFALLDIQQSIRELWQAMSTPMLADMPELTLAELNDKVTDTDVQEHHVALDSISGLTTAADKMIYTISSDAYAVTALTPFARTLLDDVDAATARATLGAVGGRTNLTPQYRIPVVGATTGDLTASTWSINGSTMTAPDVAKVEAATSLGLNSPFVGIAGATKVLSEKLGVSGPLHATISGTPPSAGGSNVAMFTNAGTPSANASISVISGNTGEAVIYLGDTDSAFRGRIIYYNDAERLEFNIAGVIAMRLSTTWAGLLTSSAFDSESLSVGGGIHAQTTSGVSCEIHCERDTHADVMIKATSTDGQIGTNSTHPLLLLSDSVEAIRIDTSQKVLIGTPTPYGTAKLSVNGNAYVNGSITSKGVITATSVKVNDYTITAADYSVVADGSSNTVTISTPLSPVTGQIFNVACLDSTFLVDIDFNGKSLYDSSSNLVLIKGENIKVQYDGTRWIGA